QTPLYAALDASFSNLFMNRGRNNAHGDYFRGDIHPLLSFPLKDIPWLSVTVKGGGRATYYSDTVSPLTLTGQDFTGRSLTRTYGEGGVSLVGPSFSRIYEFTIGSLTRWKHVIEPRVDYNYVSTVRTSDDTDLSNIPSFDEIDSVFGQNSIRYALVNRLLAKK